MRTRAPAALAAAVLICALAPAMAQAAEREHLEPYKATVDETDAGHLAAAGVDLGHSGYKPGTGGEQSVEVALFPSQARARQAKGVALREVALPTAAAKPDTGGDS